MTEVNNSREIAEIMESAMHEFSEAMEHREQLSTRIGARTTQIIRFGMAGLTILGAALFYLIFILTKDFGVITDEMKLISGYMQNMNENFYAVAGDLEEMKQTMFVLSRNVDVMPAINDSVRQMDDSLNTMSGDLHIMVEPITNMNRNVATLAGNLQLMNRQMTDMNISVGNMSGNVHQMAKPMKMFPFQ